MEEGPAPATPFSVSIVKGDTEMRWAEVAMWGHVSPPNLSTRQPSIVGTLQWTSTPVFFAISIQITLACSPKP